MREAELGSLNKGLFVFFWPFYLRRVPPCERVRVPAFDVEHAKVCLRHPKQGPEEA